MLSKPSVLLVVPVASAFEVVGGLKVCYDGFDAGAPGGAEDAEDTLSGVAHVRFVFDRYRKIENFFHLQCYEIPPHLAKFRYYCM